MSKCNTSVTKSGEVIAIPWRMLPLPQDPRGYPVPYVVLFKNNKYWFAINDEQKIIDCHQNKLCTVCGYKLGEDMWIIGGPLSAFHPNGVFNDLPVHYSCGRYSLKICPYLAMHKYESIKDLKKLEDKLNDPSMHLHDPTANNTKVPFFVFVAIKDYTLTKHFFVKPERPYNAIEMWKDGVELKSAEYYQLFAEWLEKNPTITLALPKLKT